MGWSHALLGERPMTDTRSRIVPPIGIGRPQRETETHGHCSMAAVSADSSTRRSQAASPAPAASLPHDGGSPARQGTARKRDRPGGSTSRRSSRSLDGSGEVSPDRDSNPWVTLACSHASLIRCWNGSG